MAINTITIALIGKDGKIRWIPLHKVEELVAIGYERFPGGDPKQKYYPQYDKTIKSGIALSPSDDPSLINDKEEYLDVVQIT